MRTPLRVLMVEDSEDDTLLLVRGIRQGGYDLTYERVDTPAAMEAALARQTWDIVTADWSMPLFSGFEALRLLNESGLDVPFIIVSGTVGEETAVAAMKAGAHDYVNKSHPGRLIPVIERELREAAGRRARRRAEEALQESEREKKRFYREVIRAVTHDKLHLVDADEVPVEGDSVLEVSLEEPGIYPALRKEMRALAERACMCQDNAGDLVMAASEAITNAIKHGTAGRCAVYQSGEYLIVRVSDQGKGIHPEDLPANVLVSGFSTKVSLGVGYTLMLELADRVWLATGPEGTVVQLEKRLQPAAEEEEPLLASWARL